MFIKIYDLIYIKIKSESTNIFLCGGASNKRELSVRDTLRNGLKDDKRINILYPEDLFIEMMNRYKNYDLLSLEKMLANNSDYIIIVCESAGSLVELGAFTNHDETVSKVIAIIDEKRKRDKSFIMLGPVKVLKNQSDEHVIFYKDSLDLKRKVTKNIKTLNAKKRNESKTPLDNITGLFNYLLIILYFFQKIELNILKSSLNNLYSEKHYNLEDFDTLFRPTLKLLYKNKLLEKTKVGKKTYYSLSEKGKEVALSSLYSTNIPRRNILFDKIRFDIMKKEQTPS